MIYFRRTVSWFSMKEMKPKKKICFQGIIRKWPHLIDFFGENPNHNWLNKFYWKFEFCIFLKRARLNFAFKIVKLYLFSRHFSRGETFVRLRFMMSWGWLNEISPKRSSLDKETSNFNFPFNCKINIFISFYQVKFK